MQPPRNEKGQFTKGFIPKNKVLDKSREKLCSGCGIILIKRKTESWGAWNKHKLCRECGFKAIIGSHTMKHSEESKQLMSLHKLGQIPWNKGKEVFQMRDENSSRWKGDMVGYGALHNWVELRLGKANFCSNDKNHVAPIYHWANISGEYKRDLNDWHSLCPSCNKTDGISRKGIFDEKRRRITIDMR